jgi:hypothetical protein
MGWSVREIELEVNRYRLAGIPILSSGDGYWYATNPSEVRQCAARLRSRAATQFLTARALNRAAARMEAKEALTLWQDAA